MQDRISLLRMNIARLYWRIPKFFPGSETYWNQRYVDGGTSGKGSYDRFAVFKAEVVNGFVAIHDVKSVIEFGCGDGGQLMLANYPKYIGFDVSEAAIALCQEKFGSDITKSFHLRKEYRGATADLALSLDIIYHLVEDDVFENHMAILFSSADRYVIVYSSNMDKNPWFGSAHVKHRKFTDWVAEKRANWKLIEYCDGIPGFSANFYIYEKNS